MGKRKAKKHIPDEINESTKNTLPIRKGDEVAIGFQNDTGIVKSVSDDGLSAYVDCNSKSTGSYYTGVLFLTDEVTRRLRQGSNEPSPNRFTDESSTSPTPEQTSTPEQTTAETGASFEKTPLDNVEEGDRLLLSNGETVTVTKVSKRQVRTTGNYKFVRSTGSGWSQQTVDAIPVSDQGPPVLSYQDAGVGDHVKLSDGSVVTVTKVSKRQIRAGGHKFVRSDGSGWGDESLSIK